MRHHYFELFDYINCSHLRKYGLDSAKLVIRDGKESFYIFIVSFIFLAQFMNILPCINSMLKLN